MQTPHSETGTHEDEEKPAIHSRNQSYLHETLLPSSEQAPQASSRRRRRWIFGGALAAVVILAIALGAGLGAGLRHSSSSSSDDGLSTAGLPTSPGNSSDITTTITRADLLGDQSRWQMSNRNFTISSTPTTRTFNWTLSEVMAAPGGMEKPMIVINGISPGPIVEANLGDTLIFNIYNNMTNETSMHWHGQYLFNQNYMDGTFGITQCGHTPGRMLTYNWTVQNVGTSWYHAHKGSQYTDGMYGPLIFHAPNETAMTANPYQDDYTFMIGDMYNTQGSALDWRYQALGTGLTGNPGDEPVPDGGVMNGVSQASCAYIPASNSVLPERKRSTNGGTIYPSTNYCGNLTTDFWNITFVGNHTYRIRLINPGTFLDSQFSIDNHTLTVIEADGVSVEPIKVSSVDMGIAQRYSVLVTLDQAPGAYWIRNTLDIRQQARYYSPGYSGTTLGILRYEGVPEGTMPAINSTANAPSLNISSLDTDDLVPADRMDASLPDNSTWVQFGMQYTSNNQHYMFFNSSSWQSPSPGFSSLGAIQSLGAQSSFASNTTNLDLLSTQGGALGSQLSVVNPTVGTAELVINSLDDGDHPFHLHGHTFQILSVGDKYWSGDTSTLNMTNPMRRDTIIIPAYGHLVLRYSTASPGIWVFHCHIKETWHMEIGLLLSVTNLPDQIAAFDVPQDMKDTCILDKDIGF